MRILWLALVLVALSAPVRGQSALRPTKVAVGDRVVNIENNMEIGRVAKVKVTRQAVTITIVEPIGD